MDRLRERVLLVIKELTDLAAKIADWDRRYVIACHGAGLLQSVSNPAPNLRREPANRRRDRCHGNRIEMRADEFSCEYEHRPGLVQLRNVDRTH